MNYIGGRNMLTLRGRFQSWFWIFGFLFIVFVQCKSRRAKVSSNAKASIFGEKGGDNTGLETDLKALGKGLAAEKAARIAADKELQTQIDALSGRLDTIHAALLKEIESLKTSDQTINNQLEDHKGKLEKMGITLDEHGQLIDTNTAAINVLKQENEVYKARLANLEEVTQSVQDTMKIMKGDLEGKISSLSTELKKEISAKIHDLDSKLSEEIKKVDAKVDQISEEFRDQLVQFQKLKDQINLEIMGDINKLKISFNASNKDMKSHLKELDSKVLSLFQWKEKHMADYKKRVAEIQKSQISQAQRDEAMAALERAMKIEAQNQIRLQKQLQLLSDAVDKNARAIKSNYNLIQANASRLDVQGEAIKKLDAGVTDLNAEVRGIKKQIKDQAKQIAKVAADVMAGLGENVQEAFAEISARYKELLAKKKTSFTQIINFIANYVTDQKLIINFQEEPKNIKKLEVYIESMRDFYYSLREVEFRFMLSLNLKQTKGEGDRSHELDEVYRQKVTIPCIDEKIASIKETLEGKTEEQKLKIMDFIAKLEKTKQADNAHAFDMEWPALLAKGYLNNLLFGSRSQDKRLDSIYFQQASLKEEAKAIFARRTAQFFISFGRQKPGGSKCLTLVQGVNTQVFVDKKHQSLLDGIASNKDLDKAIRIFFSKYEAMLQASSSFQTEIRMFLIAHLKDKEKVEIILEEGGNGSTIGLNYQIIVASVDASYIYHEIDIIKKRYNYYIEISKNFAKHHKKTDASLAKHETRLKTLETQMKEVMKWQSKQTKLNVTILNLIATIAIRVDKNLFADLIDVVKEEIKKQEGQFEPLPDLVDPKCEKVELAFTKNLQTGQDDASCMGEVVTNSDGKFYTDWGSYSTRRAATYLDPGCGANYDYIPASVSNNFQVKDAYFRIFASAKQLSVSLNNSNRQKHYNDAAAMKAILKAGSAQYGVYEVPVGHFISNNGRLIRRTNFTVTAKANSKEHACQKRVDFYSPIVLHFSQEDDIQTIPMDLARLSFDINANGEKEQTGWIQRDDAFLVWDRNKNGRIDDGREFFGPYSLGKHGQTHENGYEQLKTFDGDKNGIIDAQDAVFSKLGLWFDRNRNAQTDPGELVSLAEKQVTAISVDYHNVPKNRRLQGIYRIPNKLLFSGKFWGPQVCGDEGCFSYDVLFGHIESNSLALR